MSIEDQLKDIILTKYKSIRAFTIAIDIPYSTLDSILKRGISNASIDTILTIFQHLNLDVESIQTGSLSYRDNKKRASIPNSFEIEADALKIYHAFIAAGLVKEGQDLTPKQIDGLTAIIFMISALFGNDVT